MQLNWVADRKRAEDDPRNEINDYTLVDFILQSTDILKNLDLKFTVFNALDEKAKEPSPYDSAAPNGALIPGDYPLSGRSYYLGLHYHF
jgi:outer membrane receptor protein involved in Fe transport